MRRGAGKDGEIKENGRGTVLPPGRKGFFEELGVVSVSDDNKA